MSDELVKRHGFGARDEAYIADMIVRGMVEHLNGEMCTA